MSKNIAKMQQMLNFMSDKEILRWNELLGAGERVIDQTADKKVVYRFSPAAFQDLKKFSDRIVDKYLNPDSLEDIDEDISDDLRDSDIDDAPEGE